MLPTSYPQTAPMAPIQRMSVGPGKIDAVRRFNDSSTKIYDSFSPYDTGAGRIGFRQPYVWTGLNDSNFKKYIKRYDNTAFPEGSTVQDLQRTGKFMMSGTGLVFSGIQFTLQTQNAFNETRVWNPLSILTAAGKQGLFGLIPRPTRHIETSGGLLNTIATGFLSSIGITSLNTKQAPDGTALGTDGKGGGVLSQEVNMGKLSASKGLVRYQTATDSKIGFDTRFGTLSGGPKNGLFASLLAKLTKFIPSTLGGSGGGKADWKYRVEYSKSTDVYEMFRNDRYGILKYSIVSEGTGYRVSDVHRYYPDSGNKKWYFGTDNQVAWFTSNTLSTSILEKQAKDLAIGKFGMDKNYSVDRPNQIKKLPRDASTTTTTNLNKILGDTTTTKIASAVSNWNLSQIYEIGPDFYTRRVLSYQDLSSTTKSTTFRKQGDKQSLVNKKFPGANQSDEYNSLPPIQKFTGIPGELENSDGIGSRDTIFFYFFDLVNSVYIPFRATLKGINENTAVEWEDVQYMGRADKLYMYRGFTRELNFSFTVAANSVAELAPMWRRINYLSGLTRPSKYTKDGIGSLGEFIYPPMIKFRIGDLFVDQPAVIRAYGMNIPEEALWETLPDYSKYEYLIEKGVARISSGAPVAQVPMQADITITLALLEKERSETQKLRYFDTGMDGFGNPKSELTKVRNGAENEALSIAMKDAADAKAFFAENSKVTTAGVRAPGPFDAVTTTSTQKAVATSIDAAGLNKPTFNTSAVPLPAPLPTFGPGP